MNNEWNKVNRSRTLKKVKKGQKKSFNPSREYLEAAMGDYAAGGGRIIRLDSSTLSDAGALTCAFSDDAHRFLNLEF